MRKIIDISDRFPTGEFTVQPAVLVGRNGRPLREQLTKTASEATEYVQSVQPKPGHTIILVLALGSYERYGLNRNADGFNENPYRVGQRPKCGHDACYDPDGWVGQKDVIPQHYKSFEEHGHVFAHHQNSDAAKSIGDVMKAFWNPVMHRVELLIGVNNAKAPDIAERIADGKYPAVSMGCKIKFDVCTECGHRAPTRKQYCEHMKFSARQVAPSGNHVGVLNPSPKWFDISFVVKPADQTGFSMLKVAEDSSPYAVKSSAAMGEYLDRVTMKKSALRKIADIDKVVRGVAIDHKTSPLSEPEAKRIRSYRDSVMPAVQQMPAIDDDTLKSLAQHPLPEILSTLSAAGVILTTPECVKIIVEQLAPGTQLSEQILAKMVDMQGQIFDMFAEHPQLLDQLVDSGALEVSKAHVNPMVGEKAERYLEKRSTITDYLSRALIPRALRREEAPNTDPLTLSDPSTGVDYATNRGAAIKMHDAIARGQLAKILGGGALLAGGAKIVSSGLPDPLKPLAWGTAGLLGHSLLKPDYGPHYMTDQGVSIPAGTELVRQDKYGNELANVALPIAGTAGLVAALGHDYESRQRMGQPMHDPNAPLHQRAFDTISKHVHDSPATSTLLGLVLYGMGKGAFTKKAGDSVSLPEIDVDALAEKIGSLFFE